MISLGFTGDEAIITNNLFIDNHIAGADTDAVRQAEFGEPGELDPRNGLGRIVWILAVPNDTTSWTVSGNYYSVSPEVQAFYDQHAAAGVLGEGSALNWHVNRKLGADSVNAFTKESLTLGNRPTPMLAMAQWYRTPASQGGAGKTKSTANFNRALHDFDRRPWQYFADTLDCTYPTSAAAYTGAEGGYPAGDLNWYPTLKERWEQGLPVGVESRPNTVVTGYQLAQNYPNPFNPSTSITFALAKAEQVKLEVYNALGQRVATLVNGKMPAGQHSIVWDARNAPSGIYFYKLEAAGAFSQTRKMVLMK
jgi:hypothetical protein